MAYKANFGNGKLGDATELTSNVNSYARITAVDETSITIDPNTKLDGLGTFTAGDKVLIHVSATTGAKILTYLGKYLLADITEVSGNVLTLNANPTTCIPSSELANYYVQAIGVAQFQNLTLGEGVTISPPIYSTTSYVGGIVAILCSETLTFDGGHISLADKGIPPASKALRPATTNHDIAADTTSKSGNENSETKEFFLLNSGDGAAFIQAKKLICDEKSRIGNTATYGAQFYRGSSTSVTYGDTAPTKVTNVGGSTILIAAETIENFSTKMIAKYRSSASTAGQGICRCFIASETKLRNDEGLYAYDCISNPNRIKNMNIKNFGNGSFGDLNNVTAQLNNYATVTGIDGNKVDYKNATTAGLAPISAGALVMLHFNHKGSTNVSEAGRFILANVLSNNGSTLTLDTTPPQISVTDYACQVISIPQANNFTLGASGAVKTNSATVKFDGAQGGIFALAVKNKCDIAYGKITVVGKGGGSAYGRPGLAYIGNAQDSDRLPIGQGNGSIFILAQNLVMGTDTRLGHGNTGSGNYGYKDRYSSGKYGSGASAGSGSGYGSNSTKAYAGYYGQQGSHVMIVADTIKGFQLAALGTGGTASASNLVTAVSGGGCYGGYNGGGTRTDMSDYTYGGSSGWAFIYCNEAIDQVTTNVVFEN